jgi:hypothetical protein
VDEVILHIGMHKTGSSSIQESLNGYDDGYTVYANLKHANHSFAIYTIFSSGRYGYHWKSQGLGRQDIDLLRQDFLMMLTTELKRTDRKRLIISGEDIGYLSVKEKREFIVFLKQYCKKIKVICYVRSPLSFACSAFAESIKSAVITYQSRALYKHRFEGFIEDEAIEILVKVFDKKKLFKEDVVDDFCQILNLDLDLIKKVNLNISYSEASIKIIYKFLISNPCVHGDAIVNEARADFFKKIANIYADYPSLKKEYFSFFVDWTDAGFLNEKFNINFEQEAKVGNSSQEALNDYLNDLSEVDLSRIDKVLSEQNIQGNFDSLNSKLNRLFYNYIAIASSKSTFEYFIKEASKPRLSELPIDFHNLVYLILNSDLILAKVDSQQHYLKHGRFESRQYKI